MALHLSVLLIFTGLTGIHSITTVSKVSVKAGGSVSIPCLYESEYTHHVKYLCEGHEWLLCSYKVKTNQPDNSGKFSISDDKQQRIFTVTIDNLNDYDTHYWCAVEIKDGPDVKKYFKLLVTRDWPQLSVDHQEITGFNGDDVTIRCHPRTLSGGIQWCRLGGSCVKLLSGSIGGTRVTISVNVRNIVTVTMSGLRTESSGWYFCVKGDLQMPVHLTVKERPRTTTVTTTTRLSTSSPATEPVTHTSVFAHEELNTVQSENRSDCCSSAANHLTLILTLSLLIFIMMVTSFIWFMLRRHKKTEAQSSPATESEQEVAYSTVKYTRKTLNKQVEAKDEDVTYSTLALP